MISKNESVEIDSVDCKAIESRVGKCDFCKRERYTLKTIKIQEGENEPIESYKVCGICRERFNAGEFEELNNTIENYAN